MTAPIPPQIAEWAAACQVDPAELHALLSHVPTTPEGIAAGIAAMEADPEYRALADQLDRELDGASWEALQQAESQLAADAAEAQPEQQP